MSHISVNSKYSQKAIRLNELQRTIATYKSHEFFTIASDDNPPNPAVDYVNSNIFEILNASLKQLLRTVKKKNYLNEHRHTFNPIDYLSECLWNMNKHYPDRKVNWTYIFDAEWVQAYLQKQPRPFYPLSLIWSEETAATKIQIYVRGYLVRKKPEIQEFKRLWKIQLELLKLEQEDNKSDDTFDILLKNNLADLNWNCCCAE